jgi:phosphate transport system substrate-binding protein
MFYSIRACAVTNNTSLGHVTRWAKVLAAILVVGISSPLSSSPGANEIKGSVQGRDLNKAAIPLEKIQLQALNPSGIERDRKRSDKSGAFLLTVPLEDTLFRLIAWDDSNVWWGRDIPSIPNDGKHNDLKPPIVLRPQTSHLSDAEKGEQMSIIAWLKKHNPLSAAMMELHLGYFDRPGQPAQVELAGVGSANSLPLQAAWSADYESQHKDVSVSFQATASGGGIRQITSGTTDFSATDTTLTEAQLFESKNQVKQVPIALGATVLTYSDKLPADLRLSGPVLAKIYMGEIKTWNDKAVSVLNPNKDLPNLAIIPIHRADSSASTIVLTNYLSDTSFRWREVQSSSSHIDWKTGTQAKGDEGISAMVRNTDGAIGYVDFAFAEGNHLRTAALENEARQFVLASVDSISAVACEINSETDLGAILRKPRCPEAYPMSSATWMLIPTSSKDPKKVLTLLDYVNFSLGQANSKAKELGYVPLPPSLEAATKRELNNIAATTLNQAEDCQKQK